MAVYMVTWDFNSETSNYAAARTAFIKYLDAYESIYDTGLDSVRFISTSKSAEQLCAHLRQKMDADDRLLVAELRPEKHQGWLEQEVWDWINTRL